MSTTKSSRLFSDCECSPITSAVDLLSQQLWCWGRDVMRAEGNWLQEIGFSKIVPPKDREDCSSIYSLDLPHDRQVILRGFGVYYGDHARGAIYLPRYEFCPRYSARSRLEIMPWSDADLPVLSPPDISKRSVCACLLLDLLDWIRNYEIQIVDSLGLKYRQDTLITWNNGNRVLIPAEQIASEWRRLSFQVAENFDAYLESSTP